MHRSVARRSLVLTGLAVIGMTSPALTQKPKVDFGAFIQHQLSAHSEQLFGFRHPLTESVLGPYDGPNNLQAIQVADGLQVSLVSSAVASAADQIAFWPDDVNPTHVFVCDEETSTPAVQRVDLSAPANANATTIVTGLSSCDPVRRTPWGTILVAEEESDGGLYEIIDPVSITTPISVTNRATGATSDAAHLVKRQAVGALAYRGHRGEGRWRGRFMPTRTSHRTATAAVPSTNSCRRSPIRVQARSRCRPQSPLAAGTIYGLRVAASGSSRWGQGAETGNGSWVLVTMPPDGDGNINLRAAALAQKFTGYYRPEDMDVDPVAAAKGVFRACWANTGRKSHTGDSIVENSGVQSEIMCLTENPPTPFDPDPATGTIPTVDRFLTGSEQRAMYDNVAFQPRTGNLVVLEDGEVTAVKSATTTELRGNDLWICLPDSTDDDHLSDGCVRFASIRDTTAEPSGFVFFGSGREALVHIQHRAYNDGLGETNHGALVKISGFKVSPPDEFDDQQ